MELKQFCSLMELSGDAEHLLKNHWETILQAWDGSTPEFLSENFIRKYLPFLHIPEDEAEKAVIVPHSSGYVLLIMEICGCV